MCIPPVIGDVQHGSQLDAHVCMSLSCVYAPVTGDVQHGSQLAAPTRCVYAPVRRRPAWITVGMSCLTLSCVYAPVRSRKQSHCHNTCRIDADDNASVLSLLTIPVTKHEYSIYSYIHHHIYFQWDQYSAHLKKPIAKVDEKKHNTSAIKQVVQATISRINEMENL